MEAVDSSKGEGLAGWIRSALFILVGGGARLLHDWTMSGLGI